MPRSAAQKKDQKAFEECALKVIGYQGVDVTRYVEARMKGMSNEAARREVLRLFQEEA